MNMNFKPIRSNNTFFRQIRCWLVLLILFISIDASAIESRNPEIHRLSQSTNDSLVIKKTNGKKTYIIKKGREIKIWVGKPANKGTFLGVQNDTISINSNGAVLKYHKDDISKIKIFENLGRNIIGGALKIWGGAIMVAGVVPLITIGPEALIISVPAWAVGYAFYKMGDIISGNRKLNLQKNWKIY